MISQIKGGIFIVHMVSWKSHKGDMRCKLEMNEMAVIKY